MNSLKLGFIFNRLFTRLTSLNNIKLRVTFTNGNLNQIKIFNFRRNESIICVRTIKKSSVKKCESKKVKAIVESPDLYPKENVKPKKIINLLKAKAISDIPFLIVFIIVAYLFYKKKSNANEIKESRKIEYVDIPGFRKRFIRTDDSPFLLPQDFTNILDNFKNFETRNEDVWVITFPKSGTTWVQEIVFLIMNNCDFNKAKSKSIDSRSPFLEWPSPGLKAISKMESPRIIKTHLPKQYLPDDIYKKSKVVYVVRNPKDVSVSFFHFAKLVSEVDYKGGFNDWFNIFLSGNVPYGPWWKHVNDYLETSGVLVVAYEDLHTKPFETVKSIAEYLGKSLTDEQIKQIVEWCSFKNMKTNPSVNYEWQKEYGFFKKDGSFFRKGEIGDWIHYYNPEKSILMDEETNKNLKSKYEFNYGYTNQEIAKMYEFYLNKKNQTQTSKI